MKYPLLTTPNYFNWTDEFLVSHCTGWLSRFRGERCPLSKWRLFGKNKALATVVIIPQFKLCQQNLVPALSCWRQQGVGMQTRASIGRDFTAGSAPKLSLSPAWHLCRSAQGGTYTPCHMPVWISSLCLGLSAKHQETAGNLPALFLRKRQPFLEMFWRSAESFWKGGNAELLHEYCKWNLPKIQSLLWNMIPLKMGANEVNISQKVLLCSQAFWFLESWGKWH